MKISQSLQLNSVISKIEHSSSLFENKWKLKNFDERKALALSQKFDLTSIISKLLSIRNIEEEDIDFYLNPNINNHIPDPTQIKDMDTAVKRVTEAILNNQKIGIIAVSYTHLTLPTKA